MVVGHLSRATFLNSWANLQPGAQKDWFYPSCALLTLFFSYLLKDAVDLSLCLWVNQIKLSCHNWDFLNMSSLRFVSGIVSSSDMGLANLSICPVKC